MNNSFAWKGFDLEIFLQGAAGNKIYNANRASLEAMSVAQNQMTTVLDRWRGEGTSNSMPRAVFGDPNKNGRVSNRFIEDGKYLRLKNVTLGYTLPAAWSKKAAMSSVRFFVSGQNLLTLTRYMGLDPKFPDREMTITCILQPVTSRSAHLFLSNYFYIEPLID